MDATIQDRLSYLRVGSHGDNSLPDHSMVRLGHSPALDGLSALYYECKGSSTLSKDKKISKFLSKYKVAMEEYEKLRVKANDFNVKGIIGQGHFGEVRVVEENETKRIYAMKMMRKDHILQQVDAAFYLEERDIMAYSNSQWLTKLHCAFQDDRCLYLVMEYHPGGDLLNVMERNDGGMGEMEASFYLAEIVCAVNDLHMLGYVHRDLKPDNVLISTDGHIKLVDFGSASRLNNGVVVNTSLPVGTPQYISPEVLTSLDGKVPYGTCCDWWSLGIILYEMIFDVTPFEGSTTPETYNNIMNYKTTLHFPSDVVISEDVRHLISNLLIGSELRLSHDDIIKHSFFASIDWDNITSMVPPFVPVLSGPDDTSHFDSFQPLVDPNDKSFTYKSTRVFTGRNLPFVGFTFTPNNNGGTRNDDGISPIVTSQLDEMVKDIRKALEKTQKDLRSSQEQKELALKECNIYKKQLEDLQDKLEIERKDRRVSDSKALKLLSEVREQNKVAQEMRQSQAKEITEQVNGAVNQLEKERESAVKRLNWTQKELKKKQLEVDACTAKVSDLRCKLSQGRDSWKVLEANFKIKLDKLAEDYRQRANALQKDYTEIQEKYSLVSKELKTSREEVIKLENQLNSVKMASTGDTITDGDSHGDGCQSDDREEDKLLMESVQNELEMERCKMKQLNDKYNEMALHFKMLEQSLETEKLEREKIEMNKWNTTKDYNAALEEVESLRKDKATLTASCEQLTADMNTLQQQVEKYQLEIKCLKDEHSAVNPMTDGSSLQQENTVLEGEKEYLMKLSNLKDKVSAKDINIKKLNEQIDELHLKLSSLRRQLNEATQTVTCSNGKLLELRLAKKELEVEIATLKSQLAAEKDKAKESIAKTEAVSKVLEEKYTKLLNDVDNLGDISQQMKELNNDKEILTTRNTALRMVVDQLKLEREELTDKLNIALHDSTEAKTQMEVTELNMSTLKFTLSTTEEQLNDAQTLIEDNKVLMKSYEEEKQNAVSELSQMKIEFDEINHKYKLEMEAKKSLEDQTVQLKNKLDEIVGSNLMELQELREQLDDQGQMTDEYRDKVNKLEMNQVMLEHQLVELKQQYNVEHSLNGNLYNEIYQLRQEHGKLQAAHQKLIKQYQNKDIEIEEILNEKEQVMQDKAIIEEALDFERTKLRIQTAQFTKLVDYNTTTSNNSCNGGGSNERKHKMSAAAKFNRKKRNPIKERDEWNVLKKMAKGGNHSIHSGSSMKFETPKEQDKGTPNTCTTGNRLTSTPLPNTTSVSKSLGVVRTTRKRAATDADHMIAHNIPHKWSSVKSSHFPLKTNSCGTCNKTIKHSHKYMKCTYCHMTCHSDCADVTPNTCGLPKALADQLHATLSPPKKSRTSSPAGGMDKENVSILDKIKPLSVKIVRCTSISSAHSSLSITSSMLDESSTVDNSLV